MPRARQHAAVMLLGLLLSLVLPLTPTSISAASAATTTPARMTAATSPTAILRTAEETPATALSVEITSLSPTAIPASGPVIVSGTVTNADTTTWRDITLYPFIGFRAITTEAELDAAMATPEGAEVGQRIRDEGDYTRVGQLDPGQTVTFTLRVPRKHLTQRGVTDPGVYWFGVHALGSGPQGIDNVADGRARTFLPLLGKGASPVTATVIVPLRAAVTYAADGTVGDTDRWLTLLRPRGRLARLAELASTPGGRTLSWLVDPAVLAAVKRLGEGNPSRPLDVETDPSATPSPSASATAGTTTSAASTTTGTAAELATLAARWWSRMSVALSTSSVLALPYGDLDLSGAALHDPELYNSARTLSSEALTQWGIPATPVNAPVSGQLDQATISMLAKRDPGSTVLLTDALFPEGTTTAQVQTESLRLVAFDSATGAGGPAPTEALGGTALRQRVLAEAALRSLSGSSTPLVVELPGRWSVADANELGVGLPQPWLSLRSLSAAAAGSAAVALPAEDLLTDDDQTSKAIGQRTFSAAMSLIRAGRTLQRVLTDNKRVAPATLVEALTSVSYQRRGDSSTSSAYAQIALESMLSAITITAPRAVILSGSSGRFAVTVTNGLDFPVTVSLKPVADLGIAISTPRSVDVAPGSSTSIVLEANDARVGVHDVRLVLTDSAGTRLGTPVSVPVRTAQVSKIIWVFLAVGCGLLFGAIGSRLFRRIRASKRPRPEASDE